MAAAKSRVQISRSTEPSSSDDAETSMRDNPNTRKPWHQPDNDAHVQECSTTLEADEDSSVRIRGDEGTDGEGDDNNDCEGKAVHEAIRKWSVIWDICKRGMLGCGEKYDKNIINFH